MNSRRSFNSSRLSFRAIAAGSMTAVSLAFLLLLLGGGFGLFPSMVSEVSQWSGVLWGWASVSWIVSLYAGGYVASVSSRSIAKRDGLLHGFMVWSSITFLGLLYFELVSAGTFLDAFTIGMLWACLFGCALSLGGAIIGGVQGAISEHKTQLLDEKQFLQEKESKFKTAG